MSSASHTPGPWHTDWLSDDVGWVLDGQGNYLAEFVAKDECGFVVPKEEQQANAQLMAASPELLEAAKIGLGLAKSMNALGGFLGSNQQQKNVDFIQSAIAKATTIPSRA